MRPDDEGFGCHFAFFHRFDLVPVPCVMSEMPGLPRTIATNYVHIALGIKLTTRWFFYARQAVAVVVLQDPCAHLGCAGSYVWTGGEFLWARACFVECWAAVVSCDVRRSQGVGWDEAEIHVIVV